MLIQTLNRRFEVIRVLREGNDAEILVCRDLWEEELREYLLVAVKNPDLICRCAPFFTGQAANRKFKDLVECFSREGLFYVAFAYFGKPLLKDKLNGEFYFLNERLEIGKSLLSRVVLQDMPPCLLYEALQERNLLLDDALQVYFNYILEDIPYYGAISMERAQVELGGVFRRLLRQEIETLVMEEVVLFVEELEQCGFADYMAIYEAYDLIYDRLQALQESGELNPKSLLFRAWERIKKLFGYLRPVLAGLVLVTALGFLIYTAAHPAAKPGAGTAVVETIGTVKVR